MSERVGFRATIQKAGINAFLEVPKRVSAAFADFAEAGRIIVYGTLNGASVRGRLIPVRGGGHRFYINGGMRSAAHVDVGDEVALELRPTAAADVKVPTDLQDGLRKAADATEAFSRLPSARRRELIRYVDDARSPKNRASRIDKLIEHVLGKPLSGKKPAESKRRPLWTCPKCGNQFVTANMYHSCARHEISDCFEGKPLLIRELFEAMRKIVEACGPVRLVAYRDRVAFMSRVRFAGATPRRNWLDLAFWLRRRFEHPRFRRIETLYPDAHIYSVRIADIRELDDELKGWIREAYKVGCQDS